MSVCPAHPRTTIARDGSCAVCRVEAADLLHRLVAPVLPSLDVPHRIALRIGYDAATAALMEPKR